MRCYEHYLFDLVDCKVAINNYIMTILCRIDVVCQPTVIGLLGLMLTAFATLLYPRHLCRRVYSFLFSVHPFVCSLVRSFVSSLVQ